MEKRVAARCSGSSGGLVRDVEEEAMDEHEEQWSEGQMGMMPLMLNL